MGLTEELRAAVEEPPPQGFDLDQLIDRGHRRRIRSRALAGVASIVAIAVVIVGAYSVTVGWRAGGPSSSFGGPVPKTPVVHTSAPTKPTDEQTVARLTAALSGLPASLHVSDTATFTFATGGGGAWDAGYYYTAWQENGVSITIDIVAEPMPSPQENACAPGSRGDPSLSCTRTINSLGVTYVVSNVKHANVQQLTTIDSFHPDGTHVMISAVGTGKARVPSTKDLTTAAHDPDFTLHP